ncbi:MAG: hypothetical protein K9G48_12665 [Reyranella sp.]|nr:hypothetical protein [Reyranella sp.]
MTDRPILEGIRSVLKFKDTTTISEVASLTDTPRKRVLDVINRNGQFVWRDRRSGKITKVDPRWALQQQLWASGKYYKQDTYGMWAKEGDCLKFEGNSELKAQLTTKQITGAFGDSGYQDVIHDTPENRASIEAAGLRPWSEAVIDDSLWNEDAA